MSNIILLSTLAIWGGAATWAVSKLLTAPEGFEDSEGFHYGTKNEMKHIKQRAEYNTDGVFYTPSKPCIVTIDGVEFSSQRPVCTSDAVSINDAAEQLVEVNP